MIKVSFLAALLALAASQPADQQFYHNQYFDRPSYRYQEGGNIFDTLEGNGQQYYGYNPRYQGPYNDPFGQAEVIALVNDQNQPLGYVYNVNSDAAREQRKNLIRVIDNAGNVFAYYSVNRFTPGQEFVAEPISQNVVSQLAEFGIYVSQRSGETQALVFTNPNVLSYNRKGVLSPRDFENQQGASYPYNYYGQYPQQFGHRYGQQYQRPYSYQYERQYGYQYQRPYGYQYQGPYAYQYEGPYAYQYQRHYGYQYQGLYSHQYQGPYAQEYQRPYAYQYQGPYARYPNYYNQEIAAY